MGFTSVHLVLLPRKPDCYVFHFNIFLIAFSPIRLTSKWGPSPLFLERTGGIKNTILIRDDKIYEEFDMIRKLVRNFLGIISNNISHYKRVFQLFKGFNAPSCSIVKANIKSKPSVFLDYLYLFFILKILPVNYHLWCLDQKKRKEFKRYIGDSLSDPYTIKKLGILWKDYWVLLKDKLIFKLICEHYRIPVPGHFGTYQKGMGNNSQTNLQLLMLEKDLEKIVLKPRTGHLGENIHIISNNNSDISKKLSALKRGEYIVEEHIKQHPEMNKINPHSVNSIRIITLLSLDGTVEFLGAMLRTSSSTLPVDNFTMGGIAVGIDMESGRLKKEGFLKLYHRQIDNENNLKQNFILSMLTSNHKKKLLSEGKIITSSPVTNKNFYNFQIPYWLELKEITINAQKVFHHIKSIGWDIAISSTGPVIIEGNTSWGTTGIQAANGGLLTDKNRKLLAQYGITFY
jgi:hypothetical protein